MQNIMEADGPLNRSRQADGPAALLLHDGIDHRTASPQNVRFWARTRITYV